MTSGDTSSPTEVASCGALDATAAAQLLASRLEHFGSVGLAALAGLENSRSAARVLSFGDGHQIKPFIADSLSDLHESLSKLRDEQLVAANVESVDGASVTFLLRPETICRDDAVTVINPLPVAVGGATSAGGASNGGSTAGGSSASGSGGASSQTTQLDPECVKQQAEHPMRVRVSRIACGEGDNIAVELLRDAAKQRLIVALLYAERAELELDLGAYLRAVTVTNSDMTVNANGTSSLETTTKPAFSAAVGTVRGTLTLTGANQASGKISVTQAIDFTAADDSAARVRIAAGTDVATIAADGNAKTIKVVSNLGAVDWQARFGDFISGFFGLQVKDDTSTQPPVDIHIAGLRGELSLDGASDVVAADKLDLGGGPGTAIQGGQTLLSVDTRSSSGQSALAAAFIGHSNDSLGLRLPAGLRIDVDYGLAPVMTALESPANFLAHDTLTVSATPGTELVLLQEQTEDNLAVTSSLTGTLLGVESGTLSFASSAWPSDAVSVPTNQCLSRTPQAKAGHHDLLDDFLVAACSQP